MSKEAEYNGQTRTLYEWSEITGIRYDRLLKRYNKGIRGEELFRNERTVICKICGKEFVTKTVAKCCSKECKKENEVRNAASYFERAAKAKKDTKQIPKPKKEKKLTVTDIAVKAKEAGMSYGQYVAQMEGRW